MNLVVSFDQTVASLPASLVAAVNYVVSYFDSLFTNNVTVTIDLGYGEVGGQALDPGALGESKATFNSIPYQQALSALEVTGQSTSQVAAFSTLSSTSPFNSGTLWLTAAQEMAIGILPSNASGIDGYVGISNTAQFSDSADAPPAQNQYYLIGILEHEFTEVMGRVSYLGEHVGGTNSYGIMDLFRFAAPGERQLSAGGPAYFSIDGGNTHLGTWNTNPNGDLGDWATGTPADAFLAFSPAGKINSMTATDLSLMNAIGWNTSELGVAQIQVEGLAITRAIMPPDQATSIANSINSGLGTHAQFINNLLSQVTDTTIPAVAIEASMYGSVGSSAEITSLVTQFLPAQVANAIANGFNPQVYASEALGLAFAFGNEAGSTAFANLFGPSNAAMPNSAAGDAAFAVAASSAIFGSASTTNLSNVLDGFVVNWKAFYAGNGVPGIANASPTQIDIAARAAAWGDAVGVALANNLGPLNPQAINFLEDAAQGTAVYAASLTSQPNHSQAGIAYGAVSATHSDMPLVGVTSHPEPLSI